MERKLIWNVTPKAAYNNTVSNISGYAVNSDGQRMALITTGNNRFWAFMKDLVIL